MNPYDFVRIDWSKRVPRRAPSLHARFEGMAGRIEGAITTLRPLFIRGQAGSSPQQFLTNGHGQPIIPGSSLKGLARSLVETIGPGCWWFVSRNLKRKLPDDFGQCRREGDLCVACRMFGWLSGSASLQGHVGFDDAICDKPVDHSPMYTRILSSPKPTHSAFYCDPKGERVAGRKFYYHHGRPPADADGWLPKRRATGPGDAQNQFIKPVGAESQFTFSAWFDNLTEDELSLLLYVLELEPGMRHMIGYAKPLGLGSVQVELTRLELIDYRQRYNSDQAGRTVYEGQQLRRHLEEETAGYRDDSTSQTLQDLRRIWAWPGRDDIWYPDRHWFTDNPQKRLHETP